MQALILAAGSGTRLRPLTNDKPKPMVELLGRPMLEYVLDSLPQVIDEVVMVVGYKKETIQEYFGSEWKGKKIIYVNQENPQGTAHALFTAQSVIKNERFLLIPGDNVTEFSAIEGEVEHNYIIFSYEHENPKKFGVLELNEDGKTLKRIQEKPENPPTNLISTSCMVLHPSIFETEMVKHERLGEYFIPDLLTQVLENEPIYVLKQRYWIPVDSVEDVPLAEQELRERGLAE
jgi:NDP-sugar pyrophosphorylase family protein